VPGVQAETWMLRGRAAVELPARSAGGDAAIRTCLAPALPGSEVNSGSRSSGELRAVAGQTGTVGGDPLRTLGSPRSLSEASADIWRARSADCAQGAPLGTSDPVAILDNMQFQPRRPPASSTPRFCECGGRLRYRDARKYALPGVSQGHRWVCEKCGAVKTRWEAATAEERAIERAQSRRASASQRRRIREIIQKAKDQPCADCGGAFPTCVMDLDHVRGVKEFKVSEAVQKAYGIKMQRLLEEIAKCEVVCANCHLCGRSAATRTGARRDDDEICAAPSPSVPGSDRHANAVEAQRAAPGQAPLPLAANPPPSGPGRGR
jgi:hypothetical protein